MDEWIAVHDAPDFWSGHESTDGHYTPAQCLGSSNDIRCDIPMFNTPQLTGAAHTCLHFVSDQQDLIFIAELAQARPEIAGGYDSACLALHRLHDNGSNIIAYLTGDTQLLLNGVGVTIRHMKDVILRRQGGATENGLAREREGASSLAVEAAHGGDEATLARVELGEFHGTLDGLCTTAHKEAVLNVTGGNLSQQMGEHTAQGIEQLLRRQRAFLQLCLNGPHDFRMGPTEIEQSKPTQ